MTTVEKYLDIYPQGRSGQPGDTGGAGMAEYPRTEPDPGNHTG